MVVARLEGAPRDNVDSNAQELLKILEQADVIKKRGTWLEVHEQIRRLAKAPTVVLIGVSAPILVL